MYIFLNHHSGEPIYRQIVEAIKYKIVSGQVAVDEKLPSIRSLAEELKINPRTMMKAYEELQHAGLVVMRQGQGVFVSANQGTTPESLRRKAIGEMARRMLSEAFRLGASREEILNYIQAEANKMESSHE
ncbi:MAG: GntR family transcriptional regulator [Thermoguttaceae bacterium]|jgi:GntR family transcriptional regulator